MKKDLEQESVKLKKDLENAPWELTGSKRCINFFTGVLALIFFILSCLLTDQRYKDLENKSSKVHTYRRILITEFFVVVFVVGISCTLLTNLSKNAAMKYPEVRVRRCRFITASITMFTMFDS